MRRRSGGGRTLALATWGPPDHLGMAAVIQSHLLDSSRWQELSLGPRQKRSELVREQVAESSDAVFELVLGERGVADNETVGAIVRHPLAVIALRDREE